MVFSALIQIERADSKPKPGLKKRGCDYCPLDKVKGVNKVLGKVKGRKIFIFAQSPGMQENRQQKELVGPSGLFLWEELRKVGIVRKMCDIQNVVRCVPADYNKRQYPALQMRSPTKEEVKCCSIYTEKALTKSKAKLYLVFGSVAGAAVLGKEYKKDKRIFFSDILKTWVVYLDHPSYFIHQGYQAGVEKPPSESLIRFRSDLRQAKKLLSRKHSDRYQYLKEQKYVGITTRKAALKAYSRLKRDCKDGIRLVADMEEGKVDKNGQPDDNGKTVSLCCGFTTRPGTSYTFAHEHPDSGASSECKRLNKKLSRKLLRYRAYKKSFHYGPYDTDAIKKLLGVEVQGYDYDTLIGEFFRDPNARAYGLAAISERRFPNFMGYKDIRYPEAFTLEYSKKVAAKKISASQKVDVADKTGKMNLARLPWKKLVLYNGADCHLEKLVEDSTVKYVNQPLMQVYVDSGQILYRMQNEVRCKPTFDYQWYARLMPLLRHRHRTLKRKLCKLAGSKYVKIPSKKTGRLVKKKFNPNSPEQIYWLLYTKLGYTPPEEHDDTRAMTLKLLGVKHKDANIVWKYREADKIVSIAKSYKNCADLNNGQLRTIWKQTGTRTGRLSSGKTKERSDDNVINFQNIHGDPFIKVLFMSSPLWYKIYSYWKKFGAFTKKTWLKFRNVPVLLGYDFSQNELRQLAEESRDKNLIKLFAAGRDPHVEVGHEITGWPKEEIAHNDRVRKLIKNIQFGLVYGLQGEGLFRFVTAQGVKTTLKEVMRFHAKYFKRFPGVRILQEYYRDMVKKYGYVVNVFGFKRKLTGTASEEEGKFLGNIAINTPIQGASHQLLIMAIAALKRYAKKYKLLQYPMMEIHDALYFWIRLKDVWKALPLGQELMTQEPVKIIKKEFKLKKRVPLVAKPKAGFRFGVLIEGLGEGDLKHEWDFLNKWCEENQKLHKTFNKALAKLA